VLDKCIGPGGFGLPQYCIVAARPSVGKTSFALNLLRRMEGPRLLLSLEMSAGDLYDQLSKQEVQDPQHLYITDELIMLPHLCDAIEIAGKKLGCKFVVLDYINLVQVPGTFVIDNSNMAAVSRSLRAAAGRAGVALLCAAQLNRDCVKEGRRPQLQDLRDSGTLEQDADVVLMLHSDGNDETKPQASSEELEIIIRKQRKGPRNVTCWFGFDKPKCDIYEIPQREPVVEINKRRDKCARVDGQGMGSDQLNGFMRG